MYKIQPEQLLIIFSNHYLISVPEISIKLNQCLLYTIKASLVQISIENVMIY